MSAGVAVVDVSHVCYVVAAAAPRVRGGAALGARRQSGLRPPELAGEVPPGGRHPGEDTSSQSRAGNWDFANRIRHLCLSGVKIGMHVSHHYRQAVWLAKILKYALW